MERKVAAKNLVGAHEIVERFGLSRPQLVHDWRRRHPDFPAPVAVLQAGLIWDITDVEAWLRATGRLQSPPAADDAATRRPLPDPPSLVT